MQPYDDRWERTKRYLLRNFLVNPAFQLSPIPEEARSSSSGAGSPESLPELVVEREPDRHDHAPEYYAGLECRMRRYYRQLFLDETGSRDEDSSDFEVNQSMASTFIIDKNTENDNAANYVVSEKNSNYFDDEDECDINDVLTEERIVPYDKYEGERSDDYEKDEDDREENDVVANGKSTHLDKIDDVPEANKVVTIEHEKYDSDKDENIFEANHTDTKEKSADSVTDENESEANDVVTGEKIYDSDKYEDTSEENQVEREEKSADSDTDKDDSEANDVVTEEEIYDPDKYEDSSKANEVETKEIRADSHTDEDDSEANDVVTEEEMYDPDKYEDTSEANELETEEILDDSDKEEIIPEVDVVEREENTTGSGIGNVSQANVAGKPTDSDSEEAVSSINVRQVTDTENQDTCNAKLIDTHISMHRTVNTSINDLKKWLNVEEEGVEYPKLIESRSGYFLIADIDLTENSKPDHIHNLQTVENQGDYLDLNKRLEAFDEDASRTKSDSDSGPWHITSTTVAEIHETRPARAATWKFDNGIHGSPVLVPRFVQVSRGVSKPGSGPDDRRNASDFLGNVLEVSDEIIEKDSSDNTNANEFNKDEKDIEEPGAEVERLLTVSEITNVSHDSGPQDTGNVLRDIETVNIEKNQEDDAVDESNRHIIEDERQLRCSEPQTGDEESIGTDEFNYSTIDGKTSETMGNIHNDSDWDYGTDDSFETALRRGVFESKNSRKTRTQSTDEEISSIDEDCEPIEEIRGPRELGVRASLLRVSVDSQDSPVLAFEKRASAEELEDVSDISEINVSFDEDTDKNLSTHPHDTPPLIKTNITSALDDIWSVSPEEMDIEQLLNEAPQDKKRRIDPEAHESIAKRKRQDIATQTSLKTHQNWEDLKTNFFVGTPLVLRLCGCQDHVCSRRTNQTS